MKILGDVYRKKYIRFGDSSFVRYMYVPPLKTL